MRYAAWVLSVLLAGCTVTLTYPLSDAEDTPIACADGLDNDQDGAADCDDDDCDCNLCGVVTTPVADELGRLCTDDCECELGEMCNAAVDRCIRAPAPDENAFEVTFVEEIVESPEVSSGPQQNVLGTVRFNGATYDLRSMATTPLQTVFTRPESAGRQPRLRVGHHPLPRPQLDSSASYTLDDGLGPNERSLVADFSFLPSSATMLERQLSILAVVRTSVLTYEPRTETSPGFWSGHFTGVLREATSYHRAAGSACQTSEIYNPERGGCVPFVDVGELFLFGCAFTPESPPRRSGGMVYLAKPANEVREDFGDSGYCAAERLGDSVRLVAWSGPRSAFTMEVTIPAARLVGKVRIPIPGDATAVLHDEGVAEDLSSLVDATFDDPGRELDGVLAIEAVSEGEDGVLIGWIRSEAPQ